MSPTGQYGASGSNRPVGRKLDPITTQVIRHALNSAAEQMQRTLIRTAFSPLIYERLDFAPAVYDRDVRLLAQTPSLPLFMGTMGFCVEAAVEAVGGPEALAPGDIILTNDPFKTGSHPPDAALVMPVFADGRLIGYTTVKAHLADVGAVHTYSTSTTEMWQEGTIYPGVKLLSGGTLNQDIYRIVLANTRYPARVAGDIHAEIACVRAGASALEQIVRKYGVDVFEASVEAILDRGEALVRKQTEAIPDGKYVGRGVLDDDGLDDHELTFEITVEIDGSTIRIDYSRVPDQVLGPMNCPYPTTVSVSRIAIMALVGGGDAPTEGHFRPIEVITRCGSIFEPNPPAPTFLYAWPGEAAVDAIYKALAQALPEKVPAESGGDFCVLFFWGAREATGELWSDGSSHPIGQGAEADRDGASSLTHISIGGCRLSPVEVSEAKNPWLYERLELAADSGGAGRRRGGLGIDVFIRLLEDSMLTSTLERTKTPPAGLQAGAPGRANSIGLRHPDGTFEPLAGKTTARAIARGSTVELRTGGGGGFGPPSERLLTDVEHDLRQGYITEGSARGDYPHAFGSRPEPGLPAMDVELALRPTETE